MVSVVLLAALTVACDDGGPTGPSSVTPVTPVTPTVEEITVTVEAPYPPHVIWESTPRHPGIPEVTVTCQVGCEGQQPEVTDGQGRVTFTGIPPLTIRAEKPDHITVDQRVLDGGKVILGSEWPPETAASRRRLNLPPNLLLHWGAEGTLTSQYGCNVVMVKQRRADRREMLGHVEHELRHAHQDEAVPGDCSVIQEDWPETPDGLEWIATMEADREAIGLDGTYWKPWENEAQFYAAWIRATTFEWVENHLCSASARCEYFYRRYGPRPTDYP